MVTERKYGILKDNREITLYTIENSFGEFVELLNYGASIHSINVRYAKGKLKDVVLGVEKADDLLEYSLEGVTIGRCANRIADGRYFYKGKIYQLEKNKGEHFMHGASGNYAHQMFLAKYEREGSSVVFSYRDTGKGGFDCEANVQITFCFDDDHCLTISYEITPMGDTLICPTNHAYFNLTDHRDAASQLLRINADHIAVKDEEGIPHGEVKSVSGTFMDFRRFRRISEALGQAVDQGNTGKLSYDQYYLLEKDDSPAAELYAPDTHILLRVHTDMPGLIFFAPYMVEAKKGKNGDIYQGHCAVCLETQYIPNAINCPGFKKPLVRFGQTFRSTTRYEFEYRSDKIYGKKQ